MNPGEPMRWVACLLVGFSVGGAAEFSRAKEAENDAVRSCLAARVVELKTAESAAELARECVDLLWAGHAPRVDSVQMPAIKVTLRPGE